MPAPRTAMAVFCDDIRNEVGNKLTIVGMYGGEMEIAAKPPIAYPKLGVVVWIYSDIDDIPKELTVKVLGPPDETELAKLEMKGNGEYTAKYEDSKTFRIQTALIFSPVNMPGNGDFRVTVDTGRETLKAGRLRVRFVDPPSNLVVAAPA